jgi:streptogramin lyase
VFAAVGAIVLSLAFTGVGGAELPSSAALGGRVTSQAEGPMEGVLVGAKKAGSTISTWVVSNADGQYTFPRDRMEPGKYTIRIRAVGYELPKTVADVTSQPVQLDLRLNKVSKPNQLAMQLSNTEWMISAAASEEQKAMLGRCVNCHTLQRVLFSRFNPEEFTEVILRMQTHSNNASPLHPWIRPNAWPLRPQPVETASAMGKYFASINLSTRDAFDFPMKTLPRPKGKATQVIYTLYDLPRADASPHDEIFDAEGNVWYSDFNSQFIGKLDPKTGKVVEYEVPLNRLRQVPQGGLQIDIDKEGRIYFSNMFQMQLARLDPKTGKIETFPSPVPEAQLGDGHLTMIDPAFQHVDGKIWINVAGGTDESGGSWQLDLAKNKWTQITYPPGSPEARAYDVVATSKNDMYGMQPGNDKIWITNGKTLQTKWYDLPTKGTGCRRGHVDNQDRLWCAVFNGNRIAMFDPKTEKITEWTVPTGWTRPYDAQFDDRGYAWTAGMDNDLAVRLNPATGEFTEYLLPTRTNVRHVEVQKSGAFSSLWLGDQHGATLVRVEPLAP